MKHFLKESDFELYEIAEIFSLAQNFKKARKHHTPPVLSKQSWAMLFFKNSTRTRLSFEVGIQELGGTALFLDNDDLQLSRGESITDTAKIISRYVHGLIIRTFKHSDVEEFARVGTIPVINALTDFLHPCQLYSDAFTLTERWGQSNSNPSCLKERKIAFLGDCACNMANSWILGANILGMEIALAGPEEFAPGKEINNLLKNEGYENAYFFTTDPHQAVEDADVVYTDVWVSMGNEKEESIRIEKMQPYTVNDELLNLAKPDAFFMHCLPAHPEMEVTKEVLEGPKSIVLDQAENRLHVEKAILAVLAENNR